jgi:prepilin-type processing-associated H-X9-DG protein
MGDITMFMYPAAGNTLSLTSGSSGQNFRYTSYCTSIPFMVVNNNGNNGTGAGYYCGFPGAYNPPPGYSPKIGRVGDPSTKIFLAEGARYVESGSYPNVQIDFDSTAITSQGGIYCDQPIYTSITYNRSRLLFNGYGDNTKAIKPVDSKYVFLFARHGSTKAGDKLAAYRMNVAFFDGHAETMSVADALNPSIWAPKGTDITLDDSQSLKIARQLYGPQTPGEFYAN